MNELTKLCPHGRLTTAYCEPCGLKKAHEMYDELSLQEAHNLAEIGLAEMETRHSGLDQPYYDFPEDIHSCQDMIEWLELGFSNGNILKSLVREHGPTKKETSELYEAEKRYYFALRHLRHVQEAWAGGDGLSPDVEEGLEQAAGE